MQNQLFCVGWQDIAGPCLMSLGTPSSQQQQVQPVYMPSPFNRLTESDLAAAAGLNIAQADLSNGYQHSGFPNVIQARVRGATALATSEYSTHDQHAAHSLFTQWQPGSVPATLAHQLQAAVEQYQHASANHQQANLAYHGVYQHHPACFPGHQQQPCHVPSLTHQHVGLAEPHPQQQLQCVPDRLCLTIPNSSSSGGSTEGAILQQGGKRPWQGESDAIGGGTSEDVSRSFALQHHVWHLCTPCVLCLRAARQATALPVSPLWPACLVTCCW